MEIRGALDRLRETDGYDQLIHELTEMRDDEMNILTAARTESEARAVAAGRVRAFDSVIRWADNRVADLERRADKLAKQAAK